MRVLRIGIVSWLILGLGTSAFAGDLSTSIAKAVEQQSPQGQTGSSKMAKGYLWGGSMLFAAGIGTAFYGFLNNTHGPHPTFGEATATNVKLGSAGIVTAAAGGMLLLAGERHSKHSPSVTFGPGRMTISKQLSW
jgi:hypothetical protein